MPSAVNKAPWGLIVLVATLIYVPVSAPAEGVPLPGLSTSASIVRDSNHVPHLCAGTERDAFVLLGYVHAEDRLFQMDSQRRKFSGDLAELVGPEALGSDVEFRSFGLRRSAEASWAAYVEGGLTSSTEALQAYAEGVNAYLASNPLPPEYAALELTSARPWTVIDSLTILKGILLELSFDLSDLERSVAAAAYQEAGDRGGFDGMALLFDDVARFAPFDPTVSIPAAVPAAVQGRGSYTAPAPTVTRLARTTRDRLANVPSLARALRPEKRDVGSNWWLVDGAHSASGRAMLANDPHLGLGTPSTFHEAHLVVSADARCGLPEDPGGEATASTLDANGVALPGVPGLVQGCNQRICWGSTVNPVDVTDIYLETLVVDAESGVPTHTIFEGTPEPLTVLPQSFRTNQIGDGRLDHLEPVSVDPAEGGSTLLVPRRNGGPLLSTDLSAQPAVGLSVQYTGWSGSTEVEAFLGIMGAGSLAEFEDALEFFDTGSQNWAYADVDGNIAYVASGELPIREDLQELGAPDGGVPPFMIRDGAHDLRHEWASVTQPQPHQRLGFEVLPASEMPRLVNPPSGYIVNANNDPAGATLDNDLLNQTRPGGGVLYLGTDYSSLRIGRIDRLLR
ncbi:MAG: penicillin acylase family protein, partial [Acidobacteriota bacterium]